jgi:hypothetical protein
MLTNIENKVEELFEAMQKMPPDQLAAAEKVGALLPFPLPGPERMSGHPLFHTTYLSPHFVARGGRGTVPGF